MGSECRAGQPDGPLPAALCMRRSMKAAPAPHHTRAEWAAFCGDDATSVPADVAAAAGPQPPPLVIAPDVCASAQRIPSSELLGTKPLPPLSRQEVERINQQISLDWPFPAQQDPLVMVHR